MNLARAKQIEGFFSVEEMRWLAGAAAASQVVIEVGSWCGRSSRAIADNLPRTGILYCVDTFAGSANEPATHAAAEFLDGDFIYIQFCRNLFDHIEAGRVRPIRAYSRHAAMLLREQDVIADLIFIDADHTYQGCKSDLENFLPLLKKNGTICGHDYEHPFPFYNHLGVQQAVNEMFPDCLRPAGSIWCAALQSSRALLPRALIA